MFGERIRRFEGLPHGQWKPERNSFWLLLTMRESLKMSDPFTERWPPLLSCRLQKVCPLVSFNLCVLSRIMDLVILMGPAWIRHCSHNFGWQSSHSVDLAGWHAKMASIEIWIPWRNVRKPHSLNFLKDAYESIKVFRLITNNSDVDEKGIRKLRTNQRHSEHTTSYSRTHITGSDHSTESTQFLAAHPQRNECARVLVWQN